jgi:hypothetical protein
VTRKSGVLKRCEEPLQSPLLFLAAPQELMGREGHAQAAHRGTQDSPNGPAQLGTWAGLLGLQSPELEGTPFLALLAVLEWWLDQDVLQHRLLLGASVSSISFFIRCSSSGSSTLILPEFLDSLSC